MKREVKKKKTVKKPKQELTEKQQLFCLYYIKNFNATQAYLKAFNCGYNTALTNGTRMLGNASIRKEITRLKQEKKKTIMLNKDDIVERYMRIAFADMTDFVEWSNENVTYTDLEGNETTKNMNVVKFKDSKNVDGGLICQIKQGRDGSSIKLEDRQKALEWLANFFDMDPMNKHKKEFENRKLDLEKERLILLQNKSGQQETVMENDKYMESLRLEEDLWDKQTERVWADDSEG